MAPMNSSRSFLPAGCSGLSMSRVSAYQCANREETSPNYRGLLRPPGSAGILPAHGIETRRQDASAPRLSPVAPIHELDASQCRRTLGRSFRWFYDGRLLDFRYGSSAGKTGQALDLRG